MKINSILTTTGFYSTFIRLVALTLKVNNGTKLLATQHGGNFGLVKYIDSYDWLWDDIFYIWGTWKSDYEYAEGALKIAPTAKFLRYKNSQFKKNDRMVLFAGTSMFLHFDIDHVYPQKQNNREYILRQIMILSKLYPAVSGELVVRNYYVEYGWKINNYIQKKFPDIKIDDNYKSQKFFEVLLQCKLFIVDHISTTWLEALYINKPFIIIVNIDDYRVNQSARYYIEKLHDVGIIRDIDQIDEITKIYDDVDSWWNEPARQEVIKEIRDRYCFGQDMSEDEMVSWWVNELLE